MHGVVFTSFRDYVRTAFGNGVADELLAGEPTYLLSEAYPDERLLSLVTRAANRAGTGVDTVLRDFGAFTAQRTFTALYPAFFAVAGNTRSFLLTVESRIHELVRATIPNAEPPRLTISELGKDGVLIRYDSPRRLCALLIGLAEGTARHYGETATIEETSCMHRGDAECTFRIRLSAGPRA
jgi:hypothetical protein